MATSTITYLGELRTEAVHIQSGNVLITDAPVDNQGKGQAFSPTDLLATSLASCMMTIIGIAAQNHQIKLGRFTAEVTKIMASDPRRVAGIHILMRFTDGENYSEKERKIIERAALTCPVMYSLHPDIEKKLDMVWE